MRKTKRYKRIVEEWLYYGSPDGAKFMIVIKRNVLQVACVFAGNVDTLNVYLKDFGSDVKEVYDLTADLEFQLEEDIAWHID